jgi:hypothetical protein
MHPSRHLETAARKGSEHQILASMLSKMTKPSAELRRNFWLNEGPFLRRQERWEWA